MNNSPLISSTGNPLVKQLRALRQHKARVESGLFLVEGIHNVGEAVEAGWTIETLVYAPDLLVSDFGLNLVRQQSRQGVRCQVFSSELFRGFAEKENPQGLLAVVKQRHPRLEELSPGSLTWGVALVSPQDPGNVGTILRTIEAVGAGGLFLLDDGVDPYHPSAVRASMGALFWKPVIHCAFADFTEWAKRNGYQLAGSSAHASTDYRQLRGQKENCILLLGNEQKGLSSVQMEACDSVVSLPMSGHASSLNLAVAAGILLYTLADESTTDS